MRKDKDGYYHIHITMKDDDIVRLTHIHKNTDETISAIFKRLIKKEFKGMKSETHPFPIPIPNFSRDAQTRKLRGIKR
jgi:hypothetical protein